MSGPFIFIAVNERRVIAFNEYAIEDGALVAVVDRHHLGGFTRPGNR